MHPEGPAPPAMSASHGCVDAVIPAPPRGARKPRKPMGPAAVNGVPAARRLCWLSHWLACRALDGAGFDKLGRIRAALSQRRLHRLRACMRIRCVASVRGQRTRSGVSSAPEQADHRNLSSLNTRVFVSLAFGAVRSGGVSDTLTFALFQPQKVVDDQATLSVSVGCAQQGQVVRCALRVGVRASGRRIAVSARWGRIPCRRKPDARRCRLNHCHPDNSWRKHPPAASSPSGRLASHANRGMSDCRKVPRRSIKMKRDRIFFFFCQ